MFPNCECEKGSTDGFNPSCDSVLSPQESGKEIKLSNTISSTGAQLQNTQVPRLVVLESGLGLESGLECIFAGLGPGLGLDLKGLGLGLGLEIPGLGLVLGLRSFFSASPFSSPLVT